MRLTQKLKQAITAHAQSEYPRECCGLVINGEYIACTNIAPTDDQFEINPEELITATENGELQAIVHSHPDGNAEPSEIDRVQMGLHDVDWVICAIGKIADEWQSDIRRHKAAPYQAPLLGRDYIHGVQDCYSLVRDYYARECGIELNDYPRQADWWEDEDSDSLYLNNFKKEGFVEIERQNIQKHDVIICRVGRTHHPNHALVFIGDGKLISETTPPVVGSQLVLHHPHGRLSVREVFGESWQKRVAVIVRHKDFIDENHRTPRHFS